MFLCVIINVSILNIFSFDSFSVCHSLSQTVMDVTLFNFWLVTIKNVTVYRFELLKYRIYALLFYSFFVFTVIEIMSSIRLKELNCAVLQTCYLSILSVSFLSCQLLRSYGQLVLVFLHK